MVPLKARYLRSAFAVGLPCRVPAHYSGCWGLLWKRTSLLTHCSCSWGALCSLNAEYWIMMWFGKYYRLWEDNAFFTNIYARNTLSGGPEKGDPRQVPPLPSLYITLTMILYENLWNRLNTFCFTDMHTFSSDVRCKHCNVKLSLYYWTHWSCW